MLSFNQFIFEQSAIPSDLDLDSEKYIVVYSGRFQPFHISHFETYQNAANVFGKKNIVIGTSDKTEKGKSPFNFKEKQKIISNLFPIVKKNIIQVKNPFSPLEVIKEKSLSDDTAIIMVVGDKDSKRLSKSKFIKHISDVSELKPYEEENYYWIAPKNSSISGTMIRDTLKDTDTSEEEKINFLKNLYEEYSNDDIFKFIISKFNQ